MTPQDRNDIEALKGLLKQIGPDNIWRSVIIPGNKPLSGGVGDDCDGLSRDFLDHVVKNKTVIDLGCNLGFYSFLVKRAGATSVLGIDNDARVIRGCEILRRLYSLHGVRFKVKNITTLDKSETFSIGMMIDLIGKKMVQTGLVREFLNVLERVSEKEMILSIRPVYRIRKHLQNDIGRLLQKYPRQYIRKDTFFLLEYVVDRFESRWHMEVVNSKCMAEKIIKETLHFTRK